MTSLLLRDAYRSHGSNLSRSPAPVVLADLGESLRGTFDREPTDGNFGRDCKELLDRLDR